MKKLIGVLEIAEESTDLFNDADYIPQDNVFDPLKDAVH